MGTAVITAVHAGYADYLPAAYSSLRAQTRTDWIWRLQVDGPHSTAITAALNSCGALADPRLSLAANGTHEGPAVTRNVALGRTQEVLVQNLDADDELEPRALEHLHAALAAEPTAGFAVGAARDLLASGALRDFPPIVAAGLLPRGELVRAWVTDDDAYRVPVHPAGVLWHRDLLLSLGGWSAMHNMEDTSVLMAASAAADGVVIAEPTLRYRRHRLQRSKTSFFEGGGGANIARSAPGRVVTGRAGLAAAPAPGDHHPRPGRG